MANASGTKDFHGLLGKIFNALSENDLEKAGRKLAKLVRRYNEDPQVVKPALFVIDQMAAKSQKTEVAALTRNIARELPFLSGVGLMLLRKAGEIEGKPGTLPRPLALKP